MSETKEEVKKAPDGTLEQGEFKIKKKPKKLTNKKQSTTKIDLSKKEKENAILESRAGNMDETQSPTLVEKVEEEVRELPKQETPIQSKVEEKIEPEVVIEDITKQEVKSTQEVVEQVKEELKENPQLELPENVEKLVNFMK